MSCTSIFSKLAETYLMDQLREEIALAPTQFGRAKGAGTEHLLTELVTEQLQFLDDNHAATTMISVDLEKAFNRMHHQKCLQKMAERGASNKTLLLTAGFLEERKMRIKLPGHYSTLRDMPGGALQGTKCGNYLFCVTVADLSKEIPRICLLYTSPSPRDRQKSRMPSSA